MSTTNIAVLNSKSPLEVSEKVFACEFNESLVHQACVAYQAGGRAGTKKQKNRSDVRGGGAKPWKQKGTGRARAGTRSSPIWRAGGATFAARPQDHSQKLNKKMYSGALRSILSELLRKERLTVIEDKALEMGEVKTKVLLGKLTDLGLVNQASTDDQTAKNTTLLIIVSELDDNLYLSARNLKHIEIIDVAAADPVSLVGYDKILMTTTAVKQFEERLA